MMRKLFVKLKICFKVLRSYRSILIYEKVDINEFGAHRFIVDAKMCGVSPSESLMMVDYIKEIIEDEIGESVEHIDDRHSDLNKFLNNSKN